MTEKTEETEVDRKGGLGKKKKCQGASTKTEDAPASTAARILTTL